MATRRRRTLTHNQPPEQSLHLRGSRQERGEPDFACQSRFLRFLRPFPGRSTRERSQVRNPPRPSKDCLQIWSVWLAPPGHERGAKRRCSRHRRNPRSEWPSLRQMLLILIPAAWLAVVLLGMTMFRLAARSDRAQAAAWAEWIADASPAEEQPPPAERPAEQRPLRAHRAAG